MTSPAHFCLRVLQIVTRNIWTVLFFLSSLSILSLVNHYWEHLVNAVLSAQTLILSSIDSLRAL